jgi:CubicO group peptidase (beta-lactamase class C family)
MLGFAIVMTTNMKLRLRAAGLALVVVAAATAVAAAQARPAVYPGAEWEKIADPRAAGYCQDKLDLVTAKLKTLPTTAMLAVHGGRVLLEYGDLQHLSYLASVRKSILAMMYGKYVEDGTIKLDATLADLGIDDVQGLLPKEKEATVADLLAARSGVYHPAANAACTGCGSTMGDAPPRGTLARGTYFLYNNWDFNALGTIFEKLTGQDIYDAFARDFAAPLGMQDFSREAQRKTRNARSQHAAYHFTLSTRDMARLGHLMLREGEWNGTRILSRDWVRRITTIVTPVQQMNPESLRQGPHGYGYLWWIWDGPARTGAYEGAYTGSGAIGQFITVLPKLDLVVAHKTRTGQRDENGRDLAVSGSQYRQVLDLLVSARCGAGRPSLEHDVR